MADSLVARQVKSAVKAAVPLVAIETKDQNATIDSIADCFGDWRLVQWDFLRGTYPYLAVAESHESERGIEAGRYIATALGDDDFTVRNPAAAVGAFEAMEERGVLFIVNAQRWLDSSDHGPSFMQSLWNARDSLKSSSQMIVLLSEETRLPGEIATDFVLIRERLPEPEELLEICSEVYDESCERQLVKFLDEECESVESIVSPLLGLKAFQAEQAFAMAIGSDGSISRDVMWDVKLGQLGAIGGLSVSRPSVRFRDVGGCDGVKGFLKGICRSNKGAVNAVVFVDEVEKYLGSGGHSHSVEKDQLATFLKELQRIRAKGSIFVGPPGTAKTVTAEALAGELNVVLLSLDLGEMKGEYVGSSEHAIREVFKVVEAVSGGNAYWIGACNEEADLPPALKRRFRFGPWFFDLPTGEEKELIWKIKMAKYGLDDSAGYPTDDEWTGAEIESCCEIASLCGESVVWASQYIVPSAQGDRVGVAGLRQRASGKFLSAATGVKFTDGDAPARKGRRVQK